MIEQTIPEHHEQRVHGEEVLQWLAYAGNDERKLLLILALNKNNAPLGKSGLFQYMGNLTTPEGIPGSIPGDLNAPFQFCEASLLKVGAVQETTTEVMRFGTLPEIVPAFEISPSPEEREFAVAFAGSMLDWSKRHPNFTLKVLGQTSSNNDNRAPLTRFWALYDLTTTPDSPKSPSIVNIAKHLELSSNNRSNTVDRLRQLGVVRSENSFQENKRMFKIIQPDYITGPRKKPFENLGPDSKMLFSAFAKANEIKQTWGLSEFMDLVADMHPDATPEMLKKARARMHQVFVPGTYQYKGVVEAHDDRKYDANSKVELLPKAVEAIQELVTIIDKFYLGDPEIIESGKVLAKEIIDNPQTVATLYKKGYKKSNRADPQFGERLLGIMRQADSGFTNRELRDRYAAESGRNVDTRTVAAMIGQLSAAGEIEVRTVPTSRTNQQPVRYYSAIEKLENAEL